MPGLFFASVTCGVVIENTHVIFQPYTFMGSNYMATVQQDAAKTTATSVGFSFNNSRLAAVWWNVDEESDWYLVSAGDVFNASGIAQHQFTLIFAIDFAAPPVLVPAGDFYLGTNTGFFMGGGTPFPPRDVFGWVKLHNEAGALTMISNAMAYDPNGIIVGTTLIAPEPGGLALLGLAAGLTPLRRRGRYSPSITVGSRSLKLSKSASSR